MDPPKKLALDDIRQTLRNHDAILDVGFGTGELMKRLLGAGFRNIYGTEASARMVEELAAESPHLEGRLFHTEDPGVVEAAEVVLCFEVLEHVKYPQRLTQAFPGRVLYASVPNPDRWYHALTGRYEVWDSPPNHLRRFSRDDLMTLLAAAGYASISIEVMPMRAIDLLMPFTRRVNVADYDEMRDSKTWYRTLAKNALLPAAWPVAKAFGMMGYQGGSLYIKATR